jgi:hypothetical protein
VPRGARIVSAMPRFVSRSCHSGAARRQPRASSRTCTIVRAGPGVAIAPAHAARRSHRRIDDVSTAPSVAADHPRGCRGLVCSRRRAAAVRRRVQVALARHASPSSLVVVHAAMMFIATSNRSSPVGRWQLVLLAVLLVHVARIALRPTVGDMRRDFANRVTMIEFGCGNWNR